MRTFALTAHRWLTAVWIAVALTALPATAAPTSILGYDDARHLLARTGFGPTDAEIRTYAGLTREGAVGQLLRETRTMALTPPPAIVVDAAPIPLPRGDSASDADRKVFVQEQRREGLALRAWWVEEMLATPSPLTERMTLFWHNHFVSGQPKVRISRLMYRQNVLLRAHATGNFGTLLHAIGKDPAMLVYLDSAQNRKGAPNENFAREVMELFTLGEGHYTEQDVKEAARAFTGWSLDRETLTFVFRPRVHDHGTKTVFGKTGAFDGDAVLDLLLARPETAQYVTAKLWREFVSPDPDPAEVTRIAARFRASNYDIKTVLREVLLSDAFYAAQNRGVLVKSPTELVVGTLRSLGLQPERKLPFALYAAGMGQNLMSPPNVKGWPGGETWINTTTLLARKQFVDRVTRADGSTMSGEMATMQPAATQPPATQPPATQPPVAATAAMDRAMSNLQFDSARFLAQFPGASPEERARWAERLLLAVPPQQPNDRAADSHAVVRGYVLDAAYQLK